MTVSSNPNTQVSELVQSSEVWKYYHRRDNSNELAVIKPVLPPKDGCVTQRPARLHPDLIEQRDFLFAMAKCQIDDDVALHFQSLQTLYSQLTGETVCPRYGKHWGNIGFQGKDPATDLRGGGMFGLAQLLDFTQDIKNKELVDSLFKMSLDPVTGFPFAVLGINATGLCLRALREGKLTREINRRRNRSSEKGAVRDVMDDIYTACFILYERRWRQGVTSMMDAGPVWREVSETCLRKTRTALKEARQQRASMELSDDEEIETLPAKRISLAALTAPVSPLRPEAEI